jgi:hypothetical protein
MTSTARPTARPPMCRRTGGAATVVARFAALALVAIASAQPVAAQVSIRINQPGVYGRIELGNLPPPPLIDPRPVLVAPPHSGPRRVPVYLYVPVVQQRDWPRYCGRYSACGQPVYFVEERWVRERWEREGHHDNGRHRGWDKRKGADKSGAERSSDDDDRDGHRGSRHGHGRNRD